MTRDLTTSTHTSSRCRMAALGGLSLAALLALAGPAVAQGREAGAPPGNNGTVKIDGVAFDSHPGNEPHVGCRFEVDFYGFDRGDLYADVVFTVQPPTGHPAQLASDRVFIGEDDQRGGGSQDGLDAHREYDLSKALAAYPVHPQQGYHVKLTVHADGSQGADTKHKVFWVERCVTPSGHPDPSPKPETPKPDTPKPETPKPETPKPETPKPETPKPETPTPPKPETPTPPKPETPKLPTPQGRPDPLLPGNPGGGAEVQGETLSRPDALPRTGVAPLGLAGLGLALAGTGQAVRLGARFLRRG